MEKTRNSANVDPRTRRLAFCALFTALGVVLGVSGFVYKRIVILGQLMLIRLYYGPLLLDGGDVFIDYVFNKHLGCYV